MNLKQQIEQDLKTAMLAGDKLLTTTLRGLKSAILYEEVAKGLRDKGLPDAEIISVLGKEAKKRQESADLYRQGGNLTRADEEIAEKSVITRYLPVQISDEELLQLVSRAEAEVGAANGQNIGQIIAWVKSQSGGRADGQRIANAVKSRLGNT